MFGIVFFTPAPIRQAKKITQKATAHKDFKLDLDAVYRRCADEFHRTGSKDAFQEMENIDQMRAICR